MTAVTPVKVDPSQQKRPPAGVVLGNFLLKTALKVSDLKEGDAFFFDIPESGKPQLREFSIECIPDDAADKAKIQAKTDEADGLAKEIECSRGWSKWLTVAYIVVGVVSTILGFIAAWYITLPFAVIGTACWLTNLYLSCRKNNLVEQRKDAINEGQNLMARWAQIYSQAQAQVMQGIKQHYNKWAEHRMLGLGVDPADPDSASAKERRRAKAEEAKAIAAFNAIDPVIFR